VFRDDRPNVVDLHGVRPVVLIGLSMMRHERSAGFVVYRHPSGQAEREYLLLDYGRHWDYPKGHVEKDEDDLSAAKRELAEETGITDIEVIEGFAHTIVYFFRSKRDGLIRKQVVFFIGRTDASDIRLSHEHVGHAFLPYAAARKRLTYPSARKVLDAAEAHLQGRQGQ
jgi:8-oxo-dGTP pyrophosphatase MutT (NUDIX family)